MREQGLQLAIEAAGGIGALARRLGIRQPSVSSWQRIPADRVLAIEALTGIGRDRLRPDLYGGPPATADDAPIDEVELARSRNYLLAARLLRQAPDAALLGSLAKLRGDETAFGMALIELAEAASRTSAESAAEEYFALFIGIGRGEILPYTSYYLTGFLHERPLARLREDLRNLGIEKADGNFDPEDHLGLLLEVMGGFAGGTFEADVAGQKAFFDRHIAPWAQRCLADIATAPSARFYRTVAAYAGRLIEIEREAFLLEE